MCCLFVFSCRRTLDQDIQYTIEKELGLGTCGDMKFAGGSSWSSCYIATPSKGPKVFVKTAQGRTAKDMFEGEALGLEAMYGVCRGGVNTLLYAGIYMYSDIYA